MTDDYTDWGNINDIGLKNPDCLSRMNVFSSMVFVGSF